MSKIELDGLTSRSQDYGSVIVNNISNKTRLVVAGLLFSLSIAACGDDDRVNPSNPDASAAGDSKSDVSTGDSASDAAKGGTRELADAAEDVHSEAGEVKDSATDSTDADGDSPSD